MLFSVATRCPRPVHTALAASGARAFGGSPLTLHGTSHGHGSHGPKFPDFNNPSEAYQVWGLGAWGAKLILGSPPLSHHPMGWALSHARPHGGACGALIRLWISF